jgi:glycosyltransferase involved in cell wall biosynthesis
VNRGIRAQDKKEILLADSPAEFAQATVALLKDAALRKEVTTNAKRFVLQHFHWETNLRQLDDIIEFLTKPAMQSVLVEI